MRRRLLIVSVTCNVALAIVFSAVRQGAHRQPPPPAIRASLVSKSGFVEIDPNPAPVRIVPWRQIELADYRQYIANLRAVECPEWLIRAMVIADIDDLYRQKLPPEPLAFAPWEGMDARGGASRRRAAQLTRLRQEKLGLVKSQFGDECENSADTIWHLDLWSSFRLGFLPDEKAMRVLSLENEYANAAQTFREDAHFISLDEDRMQLQVLYEKFQTAMSGELTASEWQEYQLRAQKRFFITHDVHFDGVAITREEFRELTGFSKTDALTNVPTVPLVAVVADSGGREAELITRPGGRGVVLCHHR